MRNNKEQFSIFSTVVKNKKEKNRLKSHTYMFHDADFLVSRYRKDVSILGNLSTSNVKHRVVSFCSLFLLSLQVRRTRHAGHCWRSKDELISDVLLWTPAYGQAKVRRPARTYIQQLCEDTGCNPEDQPKAMNDREKWRERVRDIRAGGTT